MENALYALSIMYIDRGKKQMKCRQVINVLMRESSASRLCTLKKEQLPPKKMTLNRKDMSVIAVSQKNK
jgi:hypothetical protein